MARVAGADPRETRSMTSQRSSDGRAPYDATSSRLPRATSTSRQAPWRGWQRCWQGSRAGCLPVEIGDGDRWSSALQPSAPRRTVRSRRQVAARPPDIGPPVARRPKRDAQARHGAQALVEDGRFLATVRGGPGAFGRVLEGVEGSVRDHRVTVDGRVSGHPRVPVSGRRNQTVSRSRQLALVAVTNAVRHREELRRARGGAIVEIEAGGLPSLF